jgi:hypothetical protein
MYTIGGLVVLIFFCSINLRSLRALILTSVALINLPFHSSDLNVDQVII